MSSDADAHKVGLIPRHPDGVGEYYGGQVFFCYLQTRPLLAGLPFMDGW